jgi:hypothetical protein
MTRQQPDLIEISEELYPTYSQPLSTLPKNHKYVKRLSREIARKWEPDLMFMTCFFRGYQAHWAIRNDRLFLVEVHGLYELCVSSEVPATWFSGHIIIHEGEPKTYGYDHSDDEYDSAWIIEIKSGKVVRQYHTGGSNVP